jgi:hypothetical protein
MVVTIQRETFDGGMGNLAIPPLSFASMNVNWETFE